MGSFTFKKSVTWPSLVSELLFCREIEANIFMWPYGVCSQQEEFIYTRIISAVLHPLVYNNRQWGQKTDQHRTFKLTDTHKNTCQLHFTCRGYSMKYKLLSKVLKDLLFSPIQLHCKCLDFFLFWCFIFSF